MKHRKLRIAWSVAWGSVVVLLIALWVRSYNASEGYILKNSVRQRVVGVTTGVISISSSSPRFFDPRHPQETQGWEYQSERLPIFKDSRLLYFQLLNMRNPDFFMVGFPVWTPTLFFALLAGVPWIWQFPSRFSLRTLLIATTLVAVGLGLIVWLARV
jgi:hypothetical protein